MKRIDPRDTVPLAGILATGRTARMRRDLSSAGTSALVLGALLTLGASGALANPCAGRPVNPCAPRAVNPCRAKGGSPCAAKAANPCAAKPANPCAASAANPCAAKAANPCAANPCAPAASAKISDQQAAAIYRDLQAELQAGYAKAPLPPAAAYAGWRRYNTVPYVSETHGGRHVNNYADPKSADVYARFDPEAKFPVGATFAKDSFRPLPQGGVEKGPLFLMEKMPEGFNAASGDWKFSMVMADGAVFGVTKGQNADQVAFCAECHAGAGASHAFYLPEEYRRK